MTVLVTLWYRVHVSVPNLLPFSRFSLTDLFKMREAVHLSVCLCVCVCVCVCVSHQESSGGRRPGSHVVTGSSWGAVRHGAARTTSVPLQTDCRETEGK